MSIGVLALTTLGVGSVCFMPLLLRGLNKAVVIVPILASAIAANFMVRSWNWPELFFVAGVSTGLALAAWFINRYTRRGYILFAHIGGAVIILDVVICALYALGWALYHLPTGLRYVATGAGAVLLVVLLGMRIRDWITDKQFERRMKNTILVKLK